MIRRPPMSTLLPYTRLYRSIAREKVAVGAMLVATAVALFAGVFAVTVGAAFTVVNCQLTTVASATPSAALIVGARLAAERVAAAGGAVGGAAAGRGGSARRGG